MFKYEQLNPMMLQGIPIEKLPLDTHIIPPCASMPLKEVSNEDMILGKGLRQILDLD